MFGVKTLDVAITWEISKFGESNKSSSEEKQQYRMNTGKDETNKASSCNMSRCYKRERWLREQRRKIWYYLKKSSKPLFKRVEIVTSLELIEERQFSIEISQIQFQVWSKKWGNQSHCSNFSCFPEYRHIQESIPILMPSGKASCTNCSDEAVGSQFQCTTPSFASIHMWEDDTWHGI